MTIYDFLEKFQIDNTVKDRRWEFWGKRKIEAEEGFLFLSVYFLL